MKYRYLEEVLKLLLVNKERSSSFVNFFDNSSLLIGFNYCCKSNRFTHVSRSFKNILGYEINNALNNNNFLDKIIHQHDRVAVQNYLCKNSFETRTGTNDFKSVVLHVKCRGMHIRNYWKYLIFFSINNWNDNTCSFNKTGLIVDEHVKSFLPSVTNGIDKSSQDFFFSKEKYKKKYSQRSKICVTPREVEILELVGRGMIAKEIAHKLNVSLSTVITHRKNLLSKFHVRNTAELIKLTTKLMLA